MNIFENIILLRPLNYLRVRHKDSLLYNWIMPFIFTFCVVYVIVAIGVDTYNVDKIISAIRFLISNTMLFYALGLFLVCICDNRYRLDEPMSGIKPPSFEVLDRGVMIKHPLSLRHFIGLMCGYGFILSIFLVLSGAVLHLLLDVNYLIITILNSIYIFFSIQLMIVTLLIVYFLCDKFHRRDNNT